MQSGYLQYVLNKAYRNKIAASGTLELTARCNLSCKMCYIHRAENDAEALAQELPTAFWLDMIRQTREAGTLTMLITGGEPLLRKDFREIYFACKKAGFLVSINTNGTLLRDEDIAFFAQYPPVRVNISLRRFRRNLCRALRDRENVLTNRREYPQAPGSRREREDQLYCHTV